MPGRVGPSALWSPLCPPVGPRQIGESYYAGAVQIVPSARLGRQTATARREGGSDPAQRVVAEDYGSVRARAAATQAQRRSGSGPPIEEVD